MKLLKLLKEIFLILIGQDKPCPPPVPVPTKDQHLYCNVVIISQFKIGGIIMSTTIKSTTKSITGRFGKPLDAKGNASQVETGSVKFSSENEDIATVEPDGDDELQFKVTPTGKAGVAKINVEADADLGEGVKTISGFTAIEVQPGEAVGFGEPTFDEPVEADAEPV